MAAGVAEAAAAAAAAFFCFFVNFLVGAGAAWVLVDGAGAWNAETGNSEAAANNMNARNFMEPPR